MKRFQFKLERVLQLRKRAEEDKIRALGEIQQKINIENLRVQRFQAEMDTEDGRLRSIESEGVLDIERIKRGRTYQLGLKLKMARTGQYLKTLDLQCEARRKAYIEARKKKRVMELFREKQLVHWRDESWKEERAEADDFATMGFRRHKKD